MNYYAFNIGDYVTGTHYFTNDQDLAYRRLLDLYHASESPISNDIDSVSNKLRMNGNQAAVEFVLREKFTIGSDGLWHHARCDADISRYKKQKKDGKTGGNKRIRNQTVAKGHLLDPCDTLQPTNNQEPITSKKDLPPTPSSEGVKDDPKPKDPKNAKRSRKPATFVHDDFSPDLTNLALAGELGIPDIDRHVREFIDWWKGDGRQKCDWQATFRNRLRSIAEHRAQRAQRESSGRQGVRDVSGAALRVIAVRQQAQG